MELEIKIWGIHNTHNENMLLQDNVIAIGWKDMGDLSLIKQNRDCYKTLYKEKYKDATKMNVANGVGQLFRFVNEVKIGDYVIYPTKFNREINIGVVEGEYYYDAMEKEYPQKRKVKWLKSIKRIELSQGALYEVGSAMSFFNIKNYYDEYMKVIDGKNKKIIFDDNDISTNVATEAIIESTKDFVLKELNKNYKGYALESVVSELLIAMGYKTEIMPQGGDRGKDIIAYKDELPPRILVQVKSTNSDITENQVQSLRGAMNEGDYGLFVTLSNYSKNAKDYLRKVTVIKAINGSEFVDLLLKYYEKMSNEFKERVPLKMAYIPLVNEE